MHHGSYSNMVGVLVRRETDGGQGKRSRDDRGGEWGNTSKSHGTPRTDCWPNPEGGKGKEAFSRIGFEGSAVLLMI